MREIWGLLKCALEKHDWCPDMVIYDLFGNESTYMHMCTRCRKRNWAWGVTKVKTYTWTVTE